MNRAQTRDPVFVRGLRALAHDAAPKMAAGVVFRAPDGSVLLLKRSDIEKNFAGHWALPGGGVDPGETPEQGARRECREEIGREPTGALREISQRVTPTGLTFYTFEAKAPEKFEPKLNAEHTAHVWAKTDALPSPMHPAVRDVLAGRAQAADAGLRALAQDDRWITVRSSPNGGGSPVLLGPGGVVKGGMGGKFNGQKISEVKGPGPGRPNSRASAHAAFAPEHKAAPKWKASTTSATYSFAPTGHAYSVTVHQAAEKVSAHAGKQAKAAHEVAKRARGPVSEIGDFTGEEKAAPVKGGPAGVFMFDAGALKTDAKRFQYKDNGDKEGVTVALKGVTKWDPSKANQVIAWEDHDGQVYVVDGHQRSGLARRLIAAGHEKQISIPGILYRAKDGVDADDIRCIAAAKNIAEGSGSPIDGAKILKTRPELMDGSMPISRTEARQSFELASLNDEAFRMVTNEVVPYQQAAVVGRYIPKDADRQNAAMKALARFEPRNETEAQVLVQRVAQAELEKSSEASQMSMFGDLDEKESTAGEEMRIVAKAISELKKDKTLFARVVNNAERIEETGSSIEREAAEGVKQDSEIFIKRLTSEAYSKGPLRDKLVKAAKDLKNGGSIQDATKSVLDSLRRKSEGDVSPGAGAGGGERERADREHEDDGPGFFGDSQVRIRQVARALAPAAPTLTTREAPAMDVCPIARGLRALARDCAVPAQPRPAMDADPLRRGLRALALDAGKWDEGKHKRGQPGNAGQFGSGGAGGAAKAKSGEKKAEGAKPAPAKPADKGAEKPAGGPAAKAPPTPAAKSEPAQAAKSAEPEAASSAPATAAEEREHPYRPGLKAHGPEWAAERKALWRKSAPSTLADLVAMSPANQKDLADVCAKAAAEIGLKWKDPGVKSTDRIAEKMERGKTAQEVNDAVRGGFDTPMPEQSDKVVRALARHFEVADEGWTVTPQGYFDRKVMVRFKDGQVGEVQMWAPGMLDAKEGVGGGHKLYEAWQKSKDPKEREALSDKMNALYKGVQDGLDKAWKSIFRPNVP